MTGNATFSGTTYQARVLALIAVHMLTQRPLGWIRHGKDIPHALSGETGGPGDDARVELVGDTAAFEVQAKHGLTAGKELDDILSELPPV